jgi:hypothetical protein
LCVSCFDKLPKNVEAKELEGFEGEKKDEENEKQGKEGIPEDEGEKEDEENEIGKKEKVTRGKKKVNKTSKRGLDSIEEGVEQGKGGQESVKGFTEQTGEDNRAEDGTTGGRDELKSAGDWIVSDIPWEGDGVVTRAWGYMEDSVDKKGQTTRNNMM